MKTDDITPELAEAFREADEAREAVSRMTREEKAELESAARGVIQGARSARATSRAGH